MTPELNSVLEGIIEALQESKQKLGPDTETVGDNSHLDGKAGVGEADNIQDANDAVDKYLSDIAGELMVCKGMSQDEAADFVFHYLRNLDDEHLSELPGDDADPEELMLWLGKATTFGISAKIVKAAKEAV